MAVTQPLYVFEAVDVRRADEPDSSRARTISKLVLPGIKRKMSEHTPGGGIGSVNHVFPQIDAIEPKFSVKGIDLDVLNRFGFAAGQYDKWVFSGAVRKKQGGGMLPFRAIIEGVIAEWTPDEFAVGEILGCDHAIHEVTHYELVLDGKELWYWDEAELEGRSGGVSWFSEVRSALGG
ncbi:phage major tail tube protein [Bosea sp. (in: a-proteobacteria)]